MESITHGLDWLGAQATPVKWIVTVVVIAVAFLLLFKTWASRDTAVGPSTPKAGAQAAAVLPPQMPPSAPAAQPAVGRPSFDDYSKGFDALRGRFAEQERYIRSFEGKEVRWQGTVAYVTSVPPLTSKSDAQSRPVVIYLRNDARSTMQVRVSETFRTQAYAFIEGDTVEVEGKITRSEGHTADIDGESLKLIQGAQAGTAKK